MNEMDIAACASIVQRGDPARYRATMAAPVALRAKLLPLYAFNVEVARAPWVTQEPLIAEMRLQWWRDALDEIASGGTVRRHEVVTPLSEVLDAEGARTLDGLIEARRADIHKDAPDGRAGLAAYLGATAGTLMSVAGRLAGSQAEGALRAAGRAQGAASFVTAVPDLIAKGHHALPHGDPVEELRALAHAGLDDLAEAQTAGPDSAARPVLTVLAPVRPILRHAFDHPEQALDQPFTPAPLGATLRTLAILALGRF